MRRYANTIGVIALSAAWGGGLAACGGDQPRAPARSDDPAVSSQPTLGDAPLQASHATGDRGSGSQEDAGSATERIAPGGRDEAEPSGGAHREEGAAKAAAAPTEVQLRAAIKHMLENAATKLQPSPATETHEAGLRTQDTHLADGRTFCSDGPLLFRPGRASTALPTLRGRVVVSDGGGVWDVRIALRKDEGRQADLADNFDWLRQEGAVPPPVLKTMRHGSRREHLRVTLTDQEGAT